MDKARSRRIARLLRLLFRHFEGAQQIDCHDQADPDARTGEDADRLRLLTPSKTDHAHHAKYEAHYCGDDGNAMDAIQKMSRGLPAGEIPHSLEMGIRAVRRRRGLFLFVVAVGRIVLGFVLVLLGFLKLKADEDESAKKGDDCGK